MPQFILRFNKSQGVYFNLLGNHLKNYKRMYKYKSMREEFEIWNFLNNWLILRVGKEKTAIK